MENLPANMLLPAVLILLSLLSTAVTIVAYFLKDMRASQKEKDNKQDAAIKEVNEDLVSFKTYVLREYVDRESFIRANASLDNKIDCIFKEITEINKNLNQLLGGKQNG